MLRISRKSQTRGEPSGLMAAALMTMIATTLAPAQTGLQVQLAVRPLTPGEITAYKLPSTTETSAGLTTFGVG